MKTIEPVARIRTPYTGKFGIPRQSGLVEAECEIVFEPPYRSPESLRGLEGFSRLWLIWDFSEAKYNGTSLTVRPPRLGGNVRVGVFATRSPFRPNGLGLSCVRLLRINTEGASAPTLTVAGADMLDGTPIYDIKPYLPFTDAFPDAAYGFAEAARADRLRVTFPPDCPALPQGELDALASILAGDPRPHYQNDPERVYAFEYGGLHVKFTCDGETVYVKEVRRL